VSLLTFNNRAQLGLITDAALTPHPDEIIKHFQPAFEQLLYHALLEEGSKRDEDKPAAVDESSVAKPKRARKSVAKQTTPKTEPPAGAKPRRRRARGDVAAT
jgi:hypothetical protein